jgi:hypothetical protein
MCIGFKVAEEMFLTSFCNESKDLVMKMSIFTSSIFHMWMYIMKCNFCWLILKKENRHEVL